MKQRATLEHVVGSKISPPGHSTLLSAADQKRLNTTIVAAEINPIYIDPETKADLPLVGRALSSQVSHSLQRAAFEFARVETNDRSMHYHALGRRTFVTAVKKVDQSLADVANSFDLLLTITPTNTEAAFRAFRRSKFETAPRFHYRPTAVDPDQLKRQLWNIPIERVEDLVLDQLFREKRRELDLKLTLIAERERQQFLPTSMALYGPMGQKLERSAAEILDQPIAENGAPRQRKVGATEFIRRAEQELVRIRDIHSLMGGKIIVRNDVSSLMVSSGNLIVGARHVLPGEPGRAVDPA